MYFLLKIYPEISIVDRNKTGFFLLFNSLSLISFVWYSLNAMILGFDHVFGVCLGLGLALFGLVHSFRDLILMFSFARPWC